MDELNLLALDPTKDENVAAEFQSKQPGEEGELTIKYRIEANTADLTTLQVVGIKPSVEIPADQAIPSPTNSPIATVLDS